MSLTIVKKDQDAGEGRGQAEVEYHVANKEGQGTYKKMKIVRMVRERGSSKKR